MRPPKISFTSVLMLGIFTSATPACDEAEPEPMTFRPGPIGCSTCGVIDDILVAYAYLGLHPAFVGVGVDAVDLNLYDDAGARTVLELGALPLTEDKLTVDLDEKDLPAVIASGTVTIEFSDGRVTEDDLTIE